MGIEFYRDASLPFFELKLCAEEEVHYKRHSHEECSLGILQQGETLSAVLSRSPLEQLGGQERLTVSEHPRRRRLYIPFV